ncbi:MAG: hypothetical protein Q7U44_08170, partial [Desulfuromonadales bacterium]|nr:hypothetical protein [Desulfuromonadales bacterium]
MNILRGEIMMEMKKRIDHCGVFFAGSIGRSSMIALLLFSFALAGLLTVGDAAAALQVKHGTLTKRTTAGTTAVTGVGFTPKAVIFYWTKQTTATGAFAAHISSGQGFAAFNGAAITMGAVVAQVSDAVTTPSDVNDYHSTTAAIVSLATTANITAIESSAVVSAFDVDGFTLNWTVTTAGTADIIHYVALGGTDLTNANVGTTSMFAATGNNSVTGVGFQPDAVLLLADNISTAINTNPVSRRPAINRGFMVGGLTPTQGSIGWGMRDAQTVATHGSTFNSVQALTVLRGNAVAVNATYVSMDADGFTLSGSAASATPVTWLALKGGSYKVGTITQPVAGTPPFTTAYTGVGFLPTGLILASTNSASANGTIDTAAPGASFAFGAASAATARGSIWGHQTGFNPNDSNMNNDNTKVLRLAQSTATNNAVADFSSFNADGFTLNWTTRADTTARRILYFAMGSGASATTTIATGTEPGNLTLGPGGAATNLNAFTLQTSSGTDTVTAATVTLAPANAFDNIALVELVGNTGTPVYGSVINPASNTVNFTGMTLPVTTTLTNFYVRITPKSAAAMTGVATGASYATTGTVTAFTCTNTKVGTDSASATLTIDNASPAAPTGFSGVAGNNQVNLTWTNPGADFSSVVVLRRTGVIADVPTEGATYVTGGVAGASTVVYAGPLATYLDATVTNGVGYYYKIYARDAYGNYSSTGTTAGPYTPTGPTTTVGNGTAPPNLYLAPGAAVNDLDYFTVQTSTGTDIITGVTLLLAGGGGAPNAFSAIGTITITNASNTVLGTLNNPANDTPTVNLTTSITATTTSTQYKVRITPKSHVAMPAPPGALYTISGTVSAVTSPNTKVYSDTSSAVIEIDNASTDVATWGVITPGNTQIDMSWANPPDPDLDGTNSVVVLRKGGSAVTEVPVEGQSYIVGNTIGTATVRYVGPVEGFIDTSLTNFVD